MDNQNLEFVERKLFICFISNDDKIFLNRFIYNKAVKGDIHYNVSRAFEEGIKLMQEIFPEIPERKDKNPRGNRRGSSRLNFKGSRTSISSTNLINEWIENYICFEINKNPYYSRSLFVVDLINTLREKYKGKLLKMPKSTSN